MQRWVFTMPIKAAACFRGKPPPPSPPTSAASSQPMGLMKCHLSRPSILEHALLPLLVSASPASVALGPDLVRLVDSEHNACPEPDQCEEDHAWLNNSHGRRSRKKRAQRLSTDR